MYRSKLGRLGVGRIAPVACACALGVAGCGDSSSSSTTRPALTHSAAAAKFGPLLLGLDVASDAYVTAVYGGQPSLTEERSAIAKERDAVYTTDLAVRKLTVPQAARAAFEETGLAIISPKTPAVVKFTNWQVSKLGS